MDPNRLRCATILAAVLAFVSSAAAETKINSSLKYLRHVRNHPTASSVNNEPVRAAVDVDRAAVTIKFDHVLTAGEIAEFEKTGLSFFRIRGEVARTATIYPASVTWSRIDEVAAQSEVVRMESAWKPCMQLPLDVSGPEVEATDIWLYSDPLGLPLTGRGIRIADFDTGVDIFHPAFFYADGDTLDWLDVNANGSFTPGIDAVDINDNGMADAGEILRFNDGWISDYANVFSGSHPSNDDNVYQTYWDWLYADTNNDGDRDFGSAAGFTESDPTYGEPLYIALDDNENGSLNPGEKLVALGTSKIVATLNNNLVERLRGVDLIHSDIDQYGHGTPVAGAIAGGVPGRHRFNGVAPDAELIAGNFSVPNGANIAYMIPWARSHGADVMLHEWSMFLYQFLDGSSLDEQIISAEYDSILQVVPAGNLNGGGKHARVQLADHSSGTFYFTVPTAPYVDESFFFTARWLPGSWTADPTRMSTAPGDWWCPMTLPLLLMYTPTWPTSTARGRGERCLPPVF
jgi:subtilisin family serine protease